MIPYWVAVVIVVAVSLVVYWTTINVTAGRMAANYMALQRSNIHFRAGVRAGLVEAIEEMAKVAHKKEGMPDTRFYESVARVDALIRKCDVDTDREVLRVLSNHMGDDLEDD